MSVEEVRRSDAQNSRHNISDRYVDAEVFRELKKQQISSFM